MRSVVIKAIQILLYINNFRKGLGIMTKKILTPIIPLILCTAILSSCTSNNSGKIDEKKTKLKIAIIQNKSQKSTST